MINLTKPLLLMVLAVLAVSCSETGSEDTLAASATTVALRGTTAAPVETTSVPTETMAARPTVSCDEPITVGVVTDLTGAMSIYGAHIRRGVPIGFAYATGGQVQTGVEQSYMIDGCEVKVVFRDDKSNAELGAVAARELIESEGASIIIGSINAGVTAILQDIVREYDVILISAPASETDLTGKKFDSNTFRASRSNYQDAMAICDHLVNGAGYRTFVQVAPDYPRGHLGAQAYRDACEFYGGEFVGEDVFAPAATTDFGPYLAPLADADADAFLVTWDGGGFPRLVTSALEVGLIDDDTVLGAPFVDNIVVPAFFANVTGTTSVIPYHYTAPSNPANDYLVEQVAEKFETVPDLFDADGMNAAIMVIEALKATNGAADADALKAALEGLSFDGPKGLIEIRPEDHVALQDMYVVTLLNVDDPAFMYYENVATVRPRPSCLLEGRFASRCGGLPVGSLGG